MASCNLSYSGHTGVIKAKAYVTELTTSGTTRRVNLRVTVCSNDGFSGNRDALYSVSCTQSNTDDSVPMYNGFYINGTEQDIFNETFSVPIARGSSTVSINLTFKAALYSSSAGGNRTINGTITQLTLTKEPAAEASTISFNASSVKMGKKLLISIARDNSSCTHTLSYTFGSKTATIASDVASSYEWEVPEMASLCNDAVSGICTITCKTYLSGTLLGSNTATVTLEVPDATTPSFPDGDVIIGAGNNIGTERGSTNFLLTLTYEFNGATGTIVEDGTGDFVWWTPYDLAATIPSLTYGTGTLTCVTKNGTAVVGTKSITFRAVVPNNSTTQPKFTEEGFVLSPSGVLAEAFAGMYIRGRTCVRAEFTAESPYSKIASYKVAVSGMTATGNPAISGYLTVSGEVKVTGTVTDARGYSTSVTKTITVIPYDNPRVIPYNGQNIVVCERCLTEGLPDPGGQNLLIKAGRKYSQVAVDGVQKNFCKLMYRYKTSTADSFGDWITLISESEVLKDEVSIIAVGIVPSATTSYHVQIAVQDTIGGEPITMDFVVSTDDITFHLRAGGKGAGVGKYSEEDYLFDIHSDWDLGLKGSRIKDFVLEQGTSGIWTYRKWYSGLYECWGTDMTAPTSNYISGTFPINFPEKPKMFVSNTYDSGGFTIVIKQIHTSGGVWKYQLYLRDTTGGATRNVNTEGLDLYAVGRWK